MVVVVDVEDDVVEDDDVDDVVVMHVSHVTGHTCRTWSPRSPLLVQNDSSSLQSDGSPPPPGHPIVEVVVEVVVLEEVVVLVEVLVVELVEVVVVVEVEVDVVVVVQTPQVIGQPADASTPSGLVAVPHRLPGLLAI